MKIVFTIFFVFLFSLVVRSQYAALPFEIIKILNEKFPAWQFDRNFDDKLNQANSPVIIADWNNDGMTDYGVLIKHQAKGKLIFFVNDGKSFKFWEINREAILVINQTFMTERKLTENEIRKSTFFKHLPKNFIFPKDALGLRILEDYGAYLLAQDKTAVPKSVIFKDEREV